MSDRRVFDMSASGCDRSRHDLSVDLIVHPQCSVQRSSRMVFVSNGCTEDGEDFVTGALHYMPVVALHRVDRQLKRRVDNRARFLVSKSCSSSLEISKQRCDCLALALKALGIIAANLSHVQFFAAAGCAKPGPHFTTEVFSGHIRCTAIRAQTREWCRALRAEFAPLAVFSSVLSKNERIVR